MSERRNNGIAVPLPPRQLGFSGRMLTCAEYGLHFAKEGEHWRCVERPNLVMLRGDRYQVDGKQYGSLTDAVRAGFDAPVFDGPYEIRTDGPERDKSLIRMALPEGFEPSYQP